MDFKQRVKQYLREEEELVPNVSSKEDKSFIRKMKMLYLFGDEEGFKEMMERLNRIRRSEGLDELTPNELKSKSLWKDIKAKEKSTKDTKERIKKIEKKEKNNQVFVNMPLMDSDSLFYKRATKLFGSDFIDKHLEKYSNLSVIRVKLEGKDVFLLYGIKKVLSEEDQDLLKVISPYKYKISGNEVRFPEINKKIVKKGGTLPKIKKL